MVKGVNYFYVVKGKKVVYIDFKKDVLVEEELFKLMLGLIGNFWVLILRVGKNFVVGFNFEMYEEVFGIF